MPQVQPHPEHPEGGRKYGKFQMDLYGDGLLNNKLPTVTTDPNKLEEQAKKFMSVRSYNYVAGGAGERATMDANRLAFRQWKVCTSCALGFPWNQCACCDCLDVTQQCS